MPSTRTVRMIGCFGAMGGAAGLTISAMTWAWPRHPTLTIALLILALVAMIAAIWQYNQARFEPR